MGDIERCDTRYILDTLPSWWNAHGFKMSELTPLEKGGLSINSGRNGIAKVEIVSDQRSPGDWKVSYRLSFGPGCHSEGEITLTPGEIWDAFGVVNTEVEKPGSFVRRGRFLNIPERGDGNVQSPYISVYLTEEIREAVRELLGDTRELPIPF